MKLAAWFTAVLLWLIFWLYIFAGHYRVVAETIIVPYCFEALELPPPFQSMGKFRPCSEIDKYYDA